TSFSLDFFPTVPGSQPPCPASITTFFSLNSAGLATSKFPPNKDREVPRSSFFIVVLLSIKFVINHVSSSQVFSSSIESALLGCGEWISRSDDLIFEYFWTCFVPYTLITLTLCENYKFLRQIE